MLERTDERGRWESTDGTAWLLVEPSQAWLDSLPDGDPMVMEDPVAELQAQVAQLTAVIDALVGG